MIRMTALLAAAAVTAAAFVAATRADPSHSPAGVYVAPFQSLDAGASADGTATGLGVRQQVTATLARRAMTIVAGDPAPADAVAAGRAAGARYVVAGSVQAVAGRLRVSGEIVDLTTDAVVAGLSATGLADERLELEDRVADQAARSLRRLTAPAAAASREDDLKASDLLAIVDPPPPANRPTYAGSRLQQYLNTNRTPAQDYAQALYNSRTRNTFGTYFNYGYPIYGGLGAFGYGGYGFGGFGSGFSGGYAGFGGVAAPYGNYVIHGGGYADR